MHHLLVMDWWSHFKHFRLQGFISVNSQCFLFKCTHTSCSKNTQTLIDKPGPINPKGPSKGPLNSPLNLIPTIKWGEMMSFFPLNAAGWTLAVLVSATKTTTGSENVAPSHWPPQRWQTHWVPSGDKRGKNKRQRGVTAAWSHPSSHALYLRWSGRRHAPRLQDGQTSTS